MPVIQKAKMHARIFALNNQEVFPVGSWMVNSAEFLFAISLFINALLFIPQAWRLYKQKESKEVSLVTFIGFWVGQLLTVCHALIKNDWVLLTGYIFALITCGAVIILTVKYRMQEIK